MGATDDVDPYGILDDLSFLDDWDADTVEEALRKSEEAPSTTPESEFDRCPFCDSIRVRTKRQNRSMSHRRPEKYKCTNGHHFDKPGDENTIPMTSNRTNPFDWIDDDDLQSHDERGFTPVLRGVDDEVLTEIVLRVYRPWDHGDRPSYRDLAEIVPHSRDWVGSRVRDWKEGGYRELVDEPAPDVEETTTEPAVADGGEPSGRWAAYGSD